jgi:pimeloyl-ACP methyl ester carboxylesterase
MTEPTTHTLTVPGAELTYDVRAGDPSKTPLVLIGSPMGAGGFATLASHFPDRTVVTYDPRGVERSRKDDPTTESTPGQHADDVHAIVEAVAGGGPVDLFASSGGAVNALALVARHPGDVRTLVAHEPPVAGVVPDRAEALAAARAVGDTYQRAGFGPAMATFILLVSHEGPIPAGFGQPAPDPAMFGLPSADDGSRTDPLLFQNIVTCTHFEPDVAALRAASTRIVVGVGEESGQALAGRAGTAVAGLLGIPVVRFPGGHDGFLGGEYGQTGKPDAFAAALRRVLDDAA